MPEYWQLYQKNHLNPNPLHLRIITEIKTWLGVDL
jgi:hypothetical protein